METCVIGKYMQDISDKVKLIQDRNRLCGFDDILVAYRGESKDYKETKLMPSLFRNPDYVDKEQLLFELLGDYKVVENMNIREIEKAIEAQHYIEISRNLDITFSVLPSLFFASTSNQKEDGRIYVFGFPKYFSPHSTYIENLYETVLRGEGIVYDKNFRVMTHGRNNERIHAQSGGFIFFPGNVHNPISSIYYEEVVIKAEDKKKILKELKTLFNLDETVLFPSKEKNADKVKDIFLNSPVKKDVTEISPLNELNYLFERLDYELEIYIKSDQYTKKEKEERKREMLRLLRKEKADFDVFINRIDDKDTKKSLENESEARFRILEESKA